MTNRTKGFWISLTGILVLSPDSLSLRLVGELPDPFLIFLRAAGLVLVAWFYTLWVEKTTLIRALRNNGWSSILLYTLPLAGTKIGFVYAIMNTSVANTLISIAATPLMAALIGRIWLREKLLPITWCAIGIAFVGILIMAGGAASMEGKLGIAAALATAFGLAIAHNAARQRKEKSMVANTVLAGIVVMVIVSPSLAYLNLGGVIASPSSWDWLVLAVMALIIQPIPFICFALAPRYIRAAEVSLIMLLETALGPLLVWLVLGESPGSRAILGGTLVVSSVLVMLAAPRLWARIMQRTQNTVQRP